MKLAKLSLAAIAAVSLSTSVFAADNLAQAFKEGKISGTLQAYYFDTDNGVKDQDIFDLGLDLSYKTAALNGFTAGFTFQGTDSPWRDDASKLTSFNGTMYGTGAVLSEAYLQYAYKGAFVKVGRQYISTPLVCGSGSRITKEAFEGYVAGYTGLPQTVIAGGYATKMQRRTDGNGNIGKFSEDNIAVNAPGSKVTGYKKPGFSFDNMDNAYTIFATNNSINGLKLTVAYAHAEFDIHVKEKDKTGANYGKLPATLKDIGADIWYGEAAYTMPLDSVNVGIAGQIYTSSSDLTKDAYDNTLYGLKLSASANGLSGFVGYTSVDDNDQNSGGGVIAGVGNGTGLSYTNSFFASQQGINNDTDAYAVGIAYDFSKVGVSGLKAKAKYNSYDFPGSNDLDSYGLGVYYAFSGYLKGLSTSVEYENQSPDQGSDTDKIRVKFNYKF